MAQYEEFRFVARLDNIKALLNGMKALNSNENCSLQMSEEGMRITFQHGNSTQASLFLTRQCFAEYYVENDVVNFTVHLHTLIECLGIFYGKECSLKMSHKKNDNKLLWVLQPLDEDSNVCTEVAIKISEYEEPIDFDLNEETLNTIFLGGPDIAALFNEFDKSAEELEIIFSSQAPHFKMTALGVMQLESSVEVARTSKMILFFQCRGRSVARYSYTQLRLMHKALGVASKVALKTDQSGLLEMHFMLPAEEDGQIYLQFFIAPLVENI